MAVTDEDKLLLKKLLAEENPYFRLSEPTLMRFLDTGDVIEFDRGDPIITEGMVNPHVYIIIEGIVRSWHWVGDRDETTTFGFPGTLFMDMCCFFTGERALYSYEACCFSRLFKIRKEHLDSLIRLSHEFAQWCLSMANSQLYYYERKYAIIAGTAKARYEAMMRDRPALMKYVPLHQIASYLGITPQHLSRLRNS